MRAAESTLPADWSAQGNLDLTFLPYFDLDRGTNLLVYTRAEMEQQFAAQNPFLRRIWRESLPL